MKVKGFKHGLRKHWKECVILSGLLLSCLLYFGHRYLIQKRVLRTAPAWLIQELSESAEADAQAKPEEPQGSWGKAREKKALGTDLIEEGSHLREYETKKRGEEEEKGFPVYILGEVKNPGVYILPEGSYLQQLVERAGGLTPRADIKRINLAAWLEPNQMIYIRAVGEAGETGIRGEIPEHPSTESAAHSASSRHSKEKGACSPKRIRSQKRRQKRRPKRNLKSKRSKKKGRRKVGMVQVIASRTDPL